VLEVQVGGNITVYIYVCMRYRVTEILPSTLMCVWGRGWGKCYCVQWFASEVNCGGNITVYIEVCLRYRVREMLLFTVMCVWGTSYRKITGCSDVCLRHRVVEILLCTMMCVWGTGWGKWYCVQGCVCGTGWGNCYCLQWCLSEVQSEINVTVYNDLSRRHSVMEILLYRLMCVWGTD